MLKYIIFACLFVMSGTTMREHSGCDNYANIDCEFPNDCKMGELVTVKCRGKPSGCNQAFSQRKEAKCLYCYQTDEIDHRCQIVTNCSTSSQKLVHTTCTVNDNVICIGRRTFAKKVNCKWTSGISWTKTMILSIVLGGFGADRFYLGLWKSAIGKLFSFGGLGIWTIVDVVLIAIGYIKPGDGSNYI
ncbi:unnamed protein product [Caenorhabditis angaria]|uniref:TM2 domain-containing protein n=1 Tax=Caenorhabditis angaria TaxID=860376 RepID=A0A9P1MVM9_9PELO|nr:unnamed protein product [Caenorhabditis angaria]